MKKYDEVNGRYLAFLNKCYDVSLFNTMPATIIPQYLAEFKLSRAICTNVRELHFRYDQNTRQ